MTSVLAPWYILFMPRTTSFTLGDELDEYVRRKVEGGAYESASALIRAAVMREKENDEKEAYLAKALKEGMESGRAGTLDEVWARLKKRHPWIK